MPLDVIHHPTGRKVLLLYVDVTFYPLRFFVQGIFHTKIIIPNVLIRSEERIQTSAAATGSRRDRPPPGDA